VGGDKWLEYYYTLDTYDYNTLMAPCSGGPTPSRNCAGKLIRGPIDFRHVSFGSDYIEPDLKPMQSQEMAFGFDHQLSATSAVGVRYVKKHLVKAIEDTGALDAQQNEIYIIANPGFGLTAFAWEACPTRRPSATTTAWSSCTTSCSRTTGRCAPATCGAASGATTPACRSRRERPHQPNVGRVFDYPLMMFNETGEAEYGLLATDRPHQFKAQALYLFKFGTSVGANFYMSSGIR